MDFPILIIWTSLAGSFFIQSYYSVLIIDCFSLMIHCISQRASMRAKQFCILTTTESRVKIWRL